MSFTRRPSWRAGGRRLSELHDLLHPHPNGSTGDASGREAARRDRGARLPLEQLVRAGAPLAQHRGITQLLPQRVGAWLTREPLGRRMIVVVLHETQELVNIAHVVRAMKNFAFTDLRLVSPREYHPYRIEGIAHRSGDVLERARRFETLEPALADCIHVAGFSARERTAKRNVTRPREAAAEILAASSDGPVALLFGREDRGLSNEALDRCHRVVAIPTSPEYPSLNLGHAVALALYELALARGDEARPFKPPRRRAPPATTGDLEQVFAAAERALGSIGFFKSHASEQVMRTVREIAHRVPLDEREARLLRAMAIETAKDAARRAGGGPAGDGA